MSVQLERWIQGLETVSRMTLFGNLLLPFQLRPYQAEAVEKHLAAKKGTVIAPTGSGKTAVGVELIRRYTVPTAILAPTIPLIKQWCRVLRKAGAVPGLYYGELKQLRPITAFTLQSTSLRPELLNEFQFLIFDEVDFLGAPEYMKLLNVAMMKPYVLGMTSSIQRADGMHTKILRNLPVVYRMTLAEAREHEYVAPLQVHEVTTPMNDVESARYDGLTEKIRRTVRQFRGNMELLLQAARKGNQVALAALGAIAQRKVLLSNVESKKLRVKEIADKHPNELILLFSESIDAVNTLYNYLTTNGVPCGLYHSALTHGSREYALQGWGKHFNVLLSCRALERGIDVPSCRVGVIIASGRTSRQMIQRVGRLVRPQPNKTAECYVVAAENTVEKQYAERIMNLLQIRRPVED